MQTDLAWLHWLYRQKRAEGGTRSPVDLVIAMLAKRYPLGIDDDAERELAVGKIYDVTVNEDNPKPTDWENKLNTPIRELNFCVRTHNCLVSANIETVRDLMKHSDSQLMIIRSFGKTSLAEVKRKLTAMGLIPQPAAPDASEPIDEPSGALPAASEPEIDPEPVVAVDRRPASTDDYTAEIGEQI